MSVHNSNIETKLCWALLQCCWTREYLKTDLGLYWWDKVRVPVRVFAIKHICITMESIVLQLAREQPMEYYYCYFFSLKKEIGLLSHKYIESN